MAGGKQHFFIDLNETGGDPTRLWLQLSQYLTEGNHGFSFCWNIFTIKGIKLWENFPKFEDIFQLEFLQYFFFRWHKNN